ncbi:transposase [Candidatus Neptunichlamydia sp. REUL1]|uniref:transposase n=2 Tax=Candidatus Neptunichlamydia sp. REUL1 TaxID=3064277 RepID=UPI002931CCAA|nr:transposase [Candidatus Neptunochlamydia sp. REUL1]
MKPRKWDGRTKARAILEGIKGRKVAEICNDYQISQAQYYQWREQFLSNLDKPFEAKKPTSREERLKCENQKLKALIGGLTLELKKTEEELL